MGENSIIIAVFLLALLSVSGVGLLVGAASNGRKNRRRLERLRERYSNSTATLQAKTRRLRVNDQGSSLDQFVRGLIPRPAELRNRLACSGKNITIGRYAMACVITMIVCTATLIFFAGMPPAISLILGFMGGVGLPHLYVGRLVKKRIKKFTKLFPDAIDLMVRGLRSGLPVGQSINAVADEFEAPVGEEFAAIGDKVRFGKTLEAALWESADKIPTADFKFFVITLAIQRETGGNLAETLGNLSDILRKRQQLKLKIKAMSAEGKASAYIVGSLPFLMFGVILAMNYEYGSILFTDPRAIMVAVGALVWMGIGALVMAKMINFEI